MYLRHRPILVALIVAAIAVVTFVAHSNNHPTTEPARTPSGSFTQIPTVSPPGATPVQREILRTPLAVATVTPKTGYRTNLSPWRIRTSTMCMESHATAWPVATVAERFNRSVLTVWTRSSCGIARDRYVPIYPYSKKDGNCGYTDVLYSGTKLVKGTIYLNVAYGTLCTGGVRKAHVLSHEMGHFVGLDHTSFDTTVMSIGSWSYDNQPYLATADYRGILLRYSRP